MDTINSILDWIVANGLTMTANVIKAITVETVIIMAAIVALYQYAKNSDEQQRAMTAIEYKKRFQTVFLHLPTNIYESTFDLDALTETEKENILRYMRSYFDLASESFYLFKRKQIEKKDWHELKSSIQYAITRPAFQDAWFKLNQTRGYSVKFASFISKFIEKHNKKIKVEPLPKSLAFTHMQEDNI